MRYRNAIAFAEARSRTRVLVCFVLAVHVGLLVWINWRHGPAAPETEHISAGISHWHLRRFDLFRVNPPLVRMASAAPICMASPVVDWRRYDTNPLRRPWPAVAQDFAVANQRKTLFFVRIARLACIPFSLLGAIIAYRWGSLLYGRSSGFVALLLWCFSPYFLGHGSLVTPDAHAASIGLAAGFAFWCWLRHPKWTNALMAGAMLGVAELTKFTLVIFYPLWATMWILYRFSDRKTVSHREQFQQGVMLLAVFALGILVINLGYCFEGTFQRLDAFDFQSQSLGGVQSSSSNTESNNRFRGTWLGSLSVPFPRNYLQGIDTQRLDCERGLWSYLRGEWIRGDWWYYYVYALALKVPIGTWACGLLAALATVFSKYYSARWRDEMVVILPSVAMLVFVSSQTGFSVHSRYVLPAIPFLFVWSSKIGRAFPLHKTVVGCAVVMCIVGTVGSSLWTYPHSLSYFNELVGGPRNGHKHLLDSNMDWGQDYLQLVTWIDGRPEAWPVYVSCLGNLPRSMTGPSCTSTADAVSTDDYGVPRPSVLHPPSEPQCGWYALSVSHLHDRTGKFDYFGRLTPTTTVGYSIHIYRLTWDDINRVRQETTSSMSEEAR